MGLVTDFGDSPYAGIMRAVIKSIAGPGSCVVDLDHSVPSYSSLAGAYVVFHTYRWLPRGSIITVVVDPGVGSAREAIAVEAGDYLFIGPNNGVLYPAIAREGFRRAVAISPQRVAGMAVERFRGKLPGGRWRVSYTFHGRDLFAPAAALASMGVDLEELGEPIGMEDLARTSIDYVERNNGGYRAVVVYVDKFGNVALSIREHSIPLRLGDALIIETMTASFRVPLQRTFSDVNPGDLVAYINSFGHLEVAVNQGNASKRLGVDVGERVKILVPEHGEPVSY
ncbi:MAG: SAM-dependent chlorinase/fluorinase [Desulfurococcales archaeon]|nr:SAM-dependent chlorinase/fluorinase [Desulfurococcales archaeon]